MQSLNASWPENLVQDLYLVGKLVADLEEAVWELGDVDECYLQVLAEVREFILIHKPCNHEADDPWVTILVDLVHDLLLAIKMNRAAHHHERCVERVLIAVSAIFV